VNQLEECIECAGTGTVELRPLHSIQENAISIKCPECKGKGQVAKRQNLALQNAKEELERTILSALTRYSED
jgi:DnaJ-class molecular chaperone